MRRLLLTALSVCGMISAAQAQVTFECIGGTGFNDGEGCAKAFDGNLETKWGMYSGGDKFAVVEASEPVYLTGYTLVNADNNDNQDIKEWEIWGTNDENIANTNTTKTDGWTCFERVREHSIGYNDYSAHHISLNPSSTAYKYIMFKRVAGSSDQSQLSEITLAYSTTPDMRQRIGYTFVEGTPGYGSGQNGDKVFDNHWNTKLCANPTAYYYVAFTTDKAVNVSKVSMTTANDDKERDPKRWSLYGSTDNGATWVMIHSHDEDMPDGRKEAKTFVFDQCSVAYNWFKLEIYYTRDGNGQQKMQISELSLNEDATLKYTVKEATAGFSDGEGAASLFDSKVDTKWCCPNRESKNWYVEFKTDKELAPTGYYFTTANDDSNRDPKAWTLYGSADEGATWIELDAKADQTFTETRREYVEYAMPQPNISYSRYKLVVTDRRGGGNGLVQFGEFGLLTSSNGNLANNNHIIVYEGNGGSASESVQKMFDGNADTKWCTGPTSTVFGVGRTATLYGYGIHMANEFNYYDRRPKNWTLQGSNDYSTWTEIDKVVNDDKLPAACLALAYYSLDAPVEYKYYKFTIDATQGASIFQIGEFVPIFDGGTLNKLTLKDGVTEFTFNGNATVGELNYDRTVTKGNVATFILPVEIPVDKVNGTVWQLQEYTGSALKFTKVESGTLDANQPYLVQPTSDKLIADNKLENVRLYAAPSTEGLKKATTDGGAYQMGTYKQLASAEAVTDGTVYGYTGGKFVQAESGTLNPFRTLFVVKQGNGAAAREISLVLGDQETGIVSITKDGEIEDREVDVYDLGGRKVAQSVAGSTCLMNLPAGVYVVNGKKYVVK